MNQTASSEVEVVNAKGLHARAAALFAKTATDYDAEITVCKAELQVDGTSIMDLMMLVAGPGTRLVITGNGPDAERAVSALAELVGAGFYETD